MPTGTHLTKQQAAELLGVSTRTVERWAGKGLIGTIRIGRKVRYSHHDVAAIRAGNK